MIATFSPDVGSLQHEEKLLPDNSAQSHDSRSAWQREMEKAMELSWFAHPVIGNAHERNFPPASSAISLMRVALTAPVKLEHAAEHKLYADGSAHPASEVLRQFHPIARSQKCAAPEFHAAANREIFAAGGRTDISVAVQGLDAMQNGIPTSQLTVEQASSQAETVRPQPVGIRQQARVANGLDMSWAGKQAYATTPLQGSDGALQEASVAPESRKTLTAQLAEQLSTFVAKPVSVSVSIQTDNPLRVPTMVPLSGIARSESLIQGTSLHSTELDEADSNVSGTLLSEEKTVLKFAKETLVPEMKQPLRMHAEWSELGVRLWLGADAEVGATIPQLTRQLMRWLSDQGVSLLSLVCNGRMLFASKSGVFDVQSLESVRETAYDDYRISDAVSVHKKNELFVEQFGASMHFYQET